MPTATRTRQKSAKSNRPAPLTREEKAARIKALAERFAAWSQSQDEDKLEAYAARFDHYSARNALLIIMQMPEATVVRGFQAWKEEGRRVAKDQPGIQILAKAGERDEHPDALLPADELAPGRPRRMYFKITYVWDYSQTVPLTAAGAEDQEPAQAA